MLVQKTGWNTSWENFADNFRCRKGMEVGFPDFITEEEKDIAGTVIDELWRLSYCSYPDEEL